MHYSATLRWEARRCRPLLTKSRLSALDLLRRPPANPSLSSSPPNPLENLSLCNDTLIQCMVPALPRRLNHVNKRTHPPPPAALIDDLIDLPAALVAVPCTTWYLHYPTTTTVVAALRKIGADPTSFASAPHLLGPPTDPVPSPALFSGTVVSALRMIGVDTTAFPGVRCRMGGLTIATEAGGSDVSTPSEHPSGCPLPVRPCPRPCGPPPRTPHRP